jgi:hypothetical protein
MWNIWTADGTNDTLVNKVEEVVKAFENTPEGTNIVTALATKADKTDAITGLSVSGRTITYTKGDGSTGTITTQDTDTNTNTTYDLSAAKNKANGAVTLDLTAGGSGSGTDSVTIKGSGATSVTTDANGVITVTSSNTDTHYTKYLQIKGAGTEAVKFTQDSDKSLNFKAGNNVTVSAASGEIKFHLQTQTHGVEFKII